MKTHNQISVFLVEDNNIYAKSLQGFLLTHFPDIKIKLFPVGETCLMKMHLKPGCCDHGLFPELKIWRSSERS